MSELTAQPEPSFRRILCPVDFSDFSRHAIDHAVALAHCYGGVVKAIHVLPFPYGDPMVTPAMSPTAEDFERLRQQLADFVSHEVGRTIETEVFEGATVSSIVGCAETWPADLLVMGTHGRGGFEHLLLGSVTERMLRKAPCPVLTVPKRAPDAVPAGPAPFRRILCATDFSPASTHARGFAESLARQCQAHLTLMNVVEAVSVYEPMVLEANMRIVDNMCREALHRLQECSPRDLDVSSAVVMDGKPYRFILQRAEEEHADLIVIGVHTGLANRFRLGSTTNHIVREAECPVLTVR